MTTPARRPDIGPREGRRVTVARATRETDITVTLGLDGSGHTAIATGSASTTTSSARSPTTACSTSRSIGDGDLQVDEHHTVEDVALVLGAAFAEALGDRAGIRRFGQSSVPMDESLATAVVDVGGRPYAVIDLPFRGERVGGLPLQLVEHALEAFARTAGATLHLRAPAATTITSPRPRSRRSAARCGSRASSTRGARASPRRRARSDDATLAGPRIAVVDYGAGNLVEHRPGAHERRRRRHASPATPKRCADADALVVPGRRRGRAGDGPPRRAPA